MKKLLGILIITAFCRCNNHTNRTNTGSADSSHVTYDASKADTTTVPNGITNGEPISTDTAAYKAEDSGHRK